MTVDHVEIPLSNGDTVVFEASNISSISGQGKRASPGLLQYIVETLTAYSDTLAEIIEITGFQPRNLSSMLNGSGRNVEAGIQALADHKEDLAAIIQESPFDAKSLSSMLAGSGRNLAAGIDALVGSADEPDRNPGLKALSPLIINPAKTPAQNLKEGRVFDTQSLSSMLNGSGQDLAAGIKALVDNKRVLVTLIKDGTFDSKSLSGMLHSGGKDLAAGIKALADHKEALEQLIIDPEKTFEENLKAGRIFDSKSLSSILNSSGKDLAAGIEAAVGSEGESKENPGLKALARLIIDPEKTSEQNLQAGRIFDSKSLSGMLSGAGRDLPIGINALLDKSDALAGLIIDQEKTDDENLKAGRLFDSKSISSMLMRAGKDLPDSIQALVDNQRALKSIIEKGTFDSISISAMLHGSGKGLADGVQALVEHKKELAAIVREGHFDSKSLSSMLASSGGNLAIGIAALIGSADEPDRNPGLKALNPLMIDPAQSLSQNLEEGRIFDGKSISGMLNGSGRNLATGIKAVVDNQTLFTDMIQDGVFDSKSISGMLNGAAKDLAVGVQALHKNKTTLYEVFEDGVFDGKSISSMLRGSGKDMAAGIRALNENKSTLYRIIKEGTFDSANISSMLEGSGRDLAASVKALKDNKATLYSIIEEGTFDSTNLSSMLASSGKNLTAAVKAVHSRLDKLHDLCEVFEPNELATHLNRKSVRQLGPEIDFMHKTYQPEIQGSTDIPAGADPTIVAGSEATLPKQRGVK